MAIIYVTSDPAKWGNGTGVPHAPATADNNFYELAQRLLAVETNPPSARSIVGISVTGDQMTIHMSDATTEGPFTIPVAEITPMGEWTPNTVYPKNVFLSNSGNLYITKVAHTSDAVFDPNRVIDGVPAYVKVLAPPAQPNDYNIFLPGPMGNNQLLLFAEAIRTWQLPVNLNASKFRSQFSATAETIIALRKNGAVIGTLTWAATNTVPTINFPSLITFSPGDSFSITGPTIADATLADISLNILGTRL